MKQWYFNTSDKSWSTKPYMVKEHSVFCDGFIATVVVVPFPATKRKKNDKGEMQEEDALAFVPVGVRLEEMASKKNCQHYNLPGYSFFAKFTTDETDDGTKISVIKVSETAPYNFKKDKVGNLYLNGLFPQLENPIGKTAGILLEDHRLYSQFKKLITLAQESYDAWREEQRLAAQAAA